ncbi:hypothetical protein [Corynebacterium mastitidis]|uniref:hypothetical protein n=1 Tax=Corynebacterium mastitidis TaxID=161890 RepID=UPI00254EA568|nr:hypothetical protein [Corynebacterium mastitidis]MDK8449479.1 hypothetical protein [Corynebacterium mastitidis]
MNLKRKFVLSAATATTVADKDVVATDVKPASEKDQVEARKQRLENADKSVDIFAKVVKVIADAVARFVG